jgi:hypothetical protein
MRDELSALFSLAESLERRQKSAAAKSRAGEAQIKAGTHRRAKVSHYCNLAPDFDFENPDAEKIVLQCDENGEPLIASCLYWRIPKSERPRCGARCRDGHACRAPVVVRSDGSFKKRCRLHGGLSTGPKSAAGRAAIAQSNRRRRKT